MKRTFQWVTMFTVAASMTVVAQQQGSTTSPGMAGASSQGKEITVQGCLQPGTGMGSSASGSTGSSTYGATGATGATGSTGSTSSTGSTASGTQGATAQTAQTGQGAQAGQGSGANRAGSASGMYMLRVSDGGSGNASTGMPSSTAGQSDARAEAGKQGGRVYHLMAGSEDLSKHVGHQMEVTGTLASSATGAHSGMSSTTTPGSSGSMAATGSGSQAGTPAPTGSTAPTSGSSPTGTAAQHGSQASGTMASQAAQAGAPAVLTVKSVKMIAATCR